MGAHIVVDLEPEAFDRWRDGWPAPIATRLGSAVVRCAATGRELACDAIYVEALSAATARTLGIPDGPGCTIRLHARRKEDASAADRSPTP